jgi:hypothetical protein
MFKVQGIAYDEKIPLIYEKKINGDGYRCYTDYGYDTMTKERKDEIRSLETPYILVPRDDGDKRTLEEIYNSFIKDADEMKRETKGLVNMYKSGRDTQTALALAYHFLNQVNNLETEPILYDEYLWIEEASLGPLVFGDIYQGESYTYDLNSSYPSIFSCKTFSIPVKRGEFKYITSEDIEKNKDNGYYFYGIYKATITYPKDRSNYHKQFKLNPKNKYTHTDMKRARELGLNIKLSDSGEPNLLYYSRDKRRTGSELFGQYVKLLYPLRKNPIIKDRCKSLLRALWGVLSQRNESKMKVYFDEEFEVYESKEVIHTEFKQDHYIVHMVKKKSPYDTPFARLKPFMLAKGRDKIGKYIDQHIDHVIRCHTDSMVTNIKLDIPTSMELGDMKFEAYHQLSMVINQTRMLSINKMKDFKEINKRLTEKRVQQKKYYSKYL